MLAGLLALWGVRGLDLNVYHRMLRGAVTFGEDFEKNYMSSIFQLEKGMTQAISHFSRHNDAHVNKTRQKYIYCGNSTITAEDKIRRFYNVTGSFLLFAAVALFLINNFAQPIAGVGEKREVTGASVSEKNIENTETSVTDIEDIETKVPTNGPKNEN